MSYQALLSGQDMDTLRRLHQAGVIQLQGVRFEADSRLVEWTWEDLRHHLVTVQRLQSATGGRRYSTVEYTLQYLHALEEHEVPVQLRPPDEASWLRHVDHRLTVEGAPESALNDPRKSLKRFLKFLGEPVWPCLDRPYQQQVPEWDLPPDTLVGQFWRSPLHDDPLVSRTLQHMMHYGFYVGVRPPSELLTLDVGDIDYRGRSVWVTQWKRHGRRRHLRGLEPYIVDGAWGLRIYEQHVRPLVDRGRSDSFFLDPRTGDRWEVSRLQQDLSRGGKRVWPEFAPYTMRHWCATQRLIESDFNVFSVAQWLGDRVATVERYYLHRARAVAALEDRYPLRER